MGARGAICLVGGRPLAEPFCFGAACSHALPDQHLVARTAPRTCMRCRSQDLETHLVSLTHVCCCVVIWMTQQTLPACMRVRLCVRESVCVMCVCARARACYLPCKAPSS